MVIFNSVFNWLYQKQRVKAMFDEVLANLVPSYFYDKIEPSLARLEQYSLEIY